MTILTDFTRNLSNKSCFLIKIPCLRCDMLELYDLIDSFSKTMVVSIAGYGWPCQSCFSLNVENFRTGNGDSFNFELMYDFVSSPVNSCSFGIIFIGECF